MSNVDLVTNLFVVNCGYCGKIAKLSHCVGVSNVSTFRICVQPCGQVPQNPENNQWLGLRCKTKEMVYGLEEQERLAAGRLGNC